MSCISEAWCPQCEQIVSDSICMCACVCDRHGQVCTRIIPDGRHPIRATRKEEPHSEAEYRNNWRVGYYAWTGGMDWNGPPKWFTCEPGHPTKTPWEVEQERWNAQTKRENALRFDGVWIARGAEDRLSEGAGI